VIVGNGSITSTTGILTSTSGFTLSPSNGGTANVSAILDGSVNLTQSGGGTGILSGVNTYTGITTISAGILQISQDRNLGAVPVSAVTNEITFNGGTLQITSSFTLNPNRGITLTGAGNILVDSGQTLTYSGIITGSGNLTKSGAGILALSGTNTYTGTTDISAGTIAISNAAALGGSTSVQGTTVQSGAALSISNNITVQEPISTSGTGVASGGAIVFTSGSNTYSGTITLAADSSIVSSSGAQTISGAITGTYGLTITASDNLTLSGTIGATVYQLQQQELEYLPLMQMLQLQAHKITQLQATSQSTQTEL
jgi:autotransporter-associated beta strand protein